MVLESMSGMPPPTPASTPSAPKYTLLTVRRRGSMVMTSSPWPAAALADVARRCAQTCQRLDIALHYVENNQRVPAFSRLRAMGPPYCRDQ